MIPSTFQQAIYSEVESGSSNLVVSAVAGSGKTTTIVNAVKLLSESASIYYLAFGKAIADEIRSRVPSHITVSTFHSLGAKALYKARGSQMDEKRVYNIVTSLRDNWRNADPESVDSDYVSRVRRLVDLFRQNVAAPGEFYELASKHDIEVLNGEIERAAEVLAIMSFDTDTHDFTDMLYVPATDDSIKLPKPDYIFIDECQDLNRAQQMMLAKMMGPRTRFIAVGDPQQAIYGFAGADEESFNKLCAWPNTKVLPLSYNYRCGKVIIEYVHAIFPDLPIQAHEGAPEGEVSLNDSFREIKDGDLVLCRNTAPLVKLCLTFIKMQRKAYVKGGDMGKQMTNLVIRSRARTIEEFENWLSKELTVVFNRLAKKYPKMSSNEIKDELAYMVLAEKKEVFEVIIDSAEIQTPQELINWINELFADNKKGICFSTAHKAKGLENDRVFIIERDSMPSARARKEWQQIQECNLIYVALTRAKHRLGIITDWKYKKA